jgi:hypothetical protein
MYLMYLLIVAFWLIFQNNFCIFIQHVAEHFILIFFKFFFCVVVLYKIYYFLGKITYPFAMAMSSTLVPSQEARQSIFDRLISRPNPVLHKKKMQEIQKKIDTLLEENDGSNGV